MSVLGVQRRTTFRKDPGNPRTVHALSLARPVDAPLCFPSDSAEFPALGVVCDQGIEFVEFYRRATGKVVFKRRAPRGKGSLS